MTHNNKSESVFDQACTWFSRFQAEDVTDEEQLQFKLWYQENQQHAQAYDKVRLLWAKLEIPAEQVHAKLEAKASTYSLQHNKQPVHRRFMPYATALLIIAVLLYNPLFIKHYQNWQSDYHTATGEQLTIALSDGSQVMLNTDTAFNVAYENNERRIQLLHGEAHFKVAHNKNSPFIVSNGITNVQAMGTAFTVKESGNDVQVVVNEGTVKVFVNNSDSSALVHINQQIDTQQGQLGKVSDANIFEVLAWQRGQLIFKQQPLERVISEVNRYRRGQILLINPSLKKRIVSGVFDTSDPNAVLDALKATLKIASLNVSERLVLLY
jgi:transmembrane sensor